MEPTHLLYACFVPILHFCPEPVLYNTNCFTSPPGCPCPAPVPNQYYNIYANHAASVPGPPLYGCHDQYHTLSPALYNYQSKHAPAVYNYPMSQHAPDYDAVLKKKLKKSKPYDIINKTCYKVCGNRVSRNKGDRNETFNVGINCFTFQDLSPSSVRKKKHGKLIGNKYGTHHRCDSKAQKRSRHRYLKKNYIDPQKLELPRHCLKVKKMPTDRLVLTPTGHPKQLVSEDISEVKIDHQNRNSSSKSPEMSSKNVRGRKKRKGRSGNVFNIVGNQIKGSKADRVGIFGFGNTHVHKRPRERKTSRLHGQ